MFFYLIKEGFDGFPVACVAKCYCDAVNKLDNTTARATAMTASVQLQ